MSDDEIDKAVREAAEYEAQDKKRKEAIDARNDADSFVFQTQQALDQVGANLDAADKSEVENDMNAVKSFLDAHQNAEDDRGGCDRVKILAGEADTECTEGICKDV